jgi:hypothetical protein
LADNPPAPADSAIIRRLSAIGIGEGLHFSLTDFPRETADALKAVPQEVYAEMDRAALTPGSRSTLFGRSTADSAARLGDFKTDYNHRALVACKGLGALPPEEATYFSLYHDSEGRPLDGAYTYRLRFDAQRLPPAKAFWSITVYDADRYLVDNPIGRYAIGDRNPLQFNADGSLDIYLSHKEPVDGTAPLSNWLPLPHAAFNLTFRLYVPEAAFLQSPASWSPPLPSPQIY